MCSPPVTRLRLLAIGRRPRLRLARPATRFVAAALSVSALLSLPARPLQAGTVHWRTADGGLWNVGANWDTGSVPQSGDDVFNDLFDALITLNSSASIGSFRSNSAYTINGGTLSGSKTNQASTVQVNSAFTVINGSLNNLTINAGSGGQGVTFTGSNSISNVIFNAGASFGSGAFAETYNGSNVVNGLLNMTGGHIRLHDSNAALTVSSTSSLTGYGLLDQNGGGATLVNNGTITANTNGQTLTLAPSNITGGGTFQATNGSVLSIGGLLNGSSISVLAASGTVQIDGGGLSGSLNTTTGAGLSFSGSGGNYISNVAINNGATITLGAGAFAEVYNGGNSLDNGTATFAGGHLRLHDSNVQLTLGTAGTLSGYGLVDQNGGGATLTNNGTITANVSGQTLQIAPSFINASGTFQATNGGVLSIGGLLTGSNVRALASGGTVQFDGGGLSGSVLSTTGAGFSFTSSGGNYISNVSVSSGATLTFGSGAFAEMYNGSNTLNGAATFAGGHLRLHDSSAALTVGSMGVVQGYGLVDQNGGGATLTNNGTVTANTNGQTLTIGTSSFANNGATQTTAGATLTVNSATTNTGAIKAVAASSIFLNAGATQTAGSTTVDGTLNTNGQTFNLKGGTLGGAGILVGPVNNTGGTVNPGDSPGALALTGDYTQSGAGSLFIELGGTTQGQTYDVFKVSGAATLGGALDVKLVNNFNPFVGETFDFLTYGSRTGTFSSLVALDGYTYNVIYNDTTKVGSIVVSAAPVPEASTVLSLAGLLGLCGIARVRSRRKAA